MGRNSPETLHTMIEAKKLVWADRAKFLCDPAFAKIPVAQLISKQYAAERRKLIDLQHAAKKIEAGNPALDSRDTIYMCTADDEGNMVSLIQSNYRGMGSGIVVPGLGFMFQDRGELFSMDPQHANVYAARQTAVPYNHSRICNERRQTVGGIWRQWAAACNHKVTFKCSRTRSISA